MDAKPLNFLLVEDNDDHAQLVLRNLQRVDLLSSTHRVKDGRAALEYLEARAGSPALPDLILLDLNLPKINGIELLKILKNDEKLRSIPVIVLTTSDSETDRTGAYLGHVNSYVVKPSDFASFRALIQDLSAYWGKWNRCGRALH